MLNLSHLSTTIERQGKMVWPHFLFFTKYYQLALQLMLKLSFLPPNRHQPNLNLLYSVVENAGTCAILFSFSMNVSQVIYKALVLIYEANLLVK